MKHWWNAAFAAAGLLVATIVTAAETPAPEVIFQTAIGEEMKNVQIASAPSVRLVAWTESDKKVFRGMILDHEDTPLSEPFDISAHGLPIVNSFADITPADPQLALVDSFSLAANENRNEFLVTWSSHTVNPNYWNDMLDRLPGNELLARRITLTDTGDVELGDIRRISRVDNDMYQTRGGVLGLEKPAVIYDPVRDAFLSVFIANVEFDTAYGRKYMAATLVSPDGEPLTGSDVISPTGGYVVLERIEASNNFLLAYAENTLQRHALVGRHLAVTDEIDGLTVQSSSPQTLANASSPSFGFIINSVLHPDILVDGTDVWIAYADDTGRKLSVVHTDVNFENVTAPMVLKDGRSWRQIQRPAIAKSAIDGVYVVEHIDGIFRNLMQSVVDIANPVPEVGPIDEPLQELSLARISTADANDTAYFALDIADDGDLTNHFAQAFLDTNNSGLVVQARRIERSLDLVLSTAAEVVINAGEIANIDVNVTNQGGTAELTRLHGVAANANWTLPENVALGQVTGCNLISEDSGCMLPWLDPAQSATASLTLDTAALVCLVEPVALTVSLSVDAPQTSDPVPDNNAATVSLLVQPLADRPAECGNPDDVQLPGPGSEVGKQHRQKACENVERKGRNIPAPICGR